MQARFEMLVSHIVPVVFAIIAVLGVVGNSLVLLVVLYGQQMRNTTNILILVGRTMKCMFLSRTWRETHPNVQRQPGGRIHATY